MTTHSEILTLAAELIEKQGWLQGDFQKPGQNGKPGPISAGRAINLAAAQLSATEYERWDARYAVFSVIGDIGIEGWNDKGKQTKEAVLATFREAAGVSVTWDNHMAWAWKRPEIVPHVFRPAPAGSFRRAPSDAKISLDDLVARQKFFAQIVAANVAELTQISLRQLANFSFLTIDETREAAYRRGIDDGQRQLHKINEIIQRWIDRDQAILEGRLVEHYLGADDA